MHRKGNRKVALPIEPVKGMSEGVKGAHDGRVGAKELSELRIGG